MQKHAALGLLGLLFAGACFYPAQAEPLMQNPGPNNAQRCVEYFQIDGKSLCSTRQVLPDPDLRPARQHERIRVFFDDRPWEIGWWNKQPASPMLEYVLRGQDVHSWSELVTAQHYPGLHRKASPAQYGKAILQGIQKQGFPMRIQTLKDEPDEAVFEFKVEGTASEDVHEIFRVWKAGNGLAVLHYASKPTMSDEHRRVWFGLLSKATLK